MKAKRYALGFAFLMPEDQDPPQTPDPWVLLLTKAKPAWQKGLLNGIGGKVGDMPGHEDESPIQAMCREFEEEAGVATTPDEWEFFALMRNELQDPLVEIYCFETRVPRIYREARTMDESEPLSRHQTHQMMLLPVIPNLRIKVPLALNREDFRRPHTLVFKQHAAVESALAARATNPESYPPGPERDAMFRS